MGILQEAFVVWAIQLGGAPFCNRKRSLKAAILWLRDHQLFANSQSFTISNQRPDFIAQRSPQIANFDLTDADLVLYLALAFMVPAQPFVMHEHLFIVRECCLLITMLQIPFADGLVNFNEIASARRAERVLGKACLGLRKLLPKPLVGFIASSCLYFRST